MDLFHIVAKACVVFLASIFLYEKHIQTAKTIHHTDWTPLAKGTFLIAITVILTFGYISVLHEWWHVIEYFIDK